MIPPLGISTHKSGQVCKLTKSLYGLKQGSSGLQNFHLLLETLTFYNQMLITFFL